MKIVSGKVSVMAAAISVMLVVLVLETAAQDSTSSPGEREHKFPDAKAPITVSPQTDLRKKASVPAARVIAPKSVLWHSGHFDHRNPIMDEPLLERHGLTHSAKKQFLISGSKFFSKGFFLPYKILLQRHKRTDDSFGWAIVGEKRDNFRVPRNE